MPQVGWISDKKPSLLEFIILIAHAKWVEPLIFSLWYLYVCLLVVSYNIFPNFEILEWGSKFSDTVGT